MLYLTGKDPGDLAWIFRKILDYNAFDYLISSLSVSTEIVTNVM